MANDAVRSLVEPFRGMILDLGAGDGSGAVRRVAPGVTRWVGVDLSHHPDVRADATMTLPFRDGSFDAAVCIWFLYIAPDPEAVLSDVRRVLRRGAPFVWSVPFMFSVNPEPRDLWRFTNYGISELMQRAGFEETEIVPLGGRWTSAYFLLDPYVRPRRILGPLVTRVALALDAHADRRGLAPGPAGYLVRGRA